MITSLRRMVTCQWSARRIGRYLDDDPSARLTQLEVRRLEEHLANCARCAKVTTEHRVLNRALSLWSQKRLPDEAAMRRLQEALDRITKDGSQ
jgi:anti-sigma factor RsiW